MHLMQALYYFESTLKITVVCTVNLFEYTADTAFKVFLF